MIIINLCGLVLVWHSWALNIIPQALFKTVVLGNIYEQCKYCNPHLCSGQWRLTILIKAKYIINEKFVTLLLSHESWSSVANYELSFSIKYKCDIDVYIYLIL